MEEIRIKLDIPVEFKQEFSLALSRIVERFVREMDLTITKDIISKSKLTEQDAEDLSKEVKKSLHEKYKKMYPELG